MDYRYLKSFLVLGKWLQFTNAALDLNIAPSALSRQIKLLEESVGQDLFLRSNRKVSLTNFGRKLYAHAQQFEAMLSSETESSEIHIGCLQSVFEFYLAEVLKSYKTNPYKKIKITISSPSQLEEALKKGELDLVISNQKPTSNLLKSKFLYKESMCVFRNNSKDWVVLSHFDVDYQKYISQGARTIEVNSLGAARQMIAEGQGSGILPARLHTNFKGCVREEIKTSNENVYLISAVTKNETSNLKSFKNALVQHVEKN